MHGTMAVYSMLFIAVIFEVLGASFLEKANGLQHISAIIISIIFYLASFILGAYILKDMPVAVMYAVWVGIGIILTAIAGYFLNNQQLDLPAMLGIALIGIGVVIIYWFSKSVA